MVVLAGSILATMQVLGVTLVAAALVIPAAIARMLTNSFARMLQLATGIGAVCGFVGMNLSYHLDIQSRSDDRARRRDAVRDRLRRHRRDGPAPRRGDRRSRAARRARRLSGRQLLAPRASVAALALLGAAGAQPDDREVREARFEARQLADLLADAVERGRLDGLQRAARLAGEVLAIAEALEHVAPGSVAGVEVAHEAELAERLEVAVDRGDVRLRSSSLRARRRCPPRRSVRVPRAAPRARDGAPRSGAIRCGGPRRSPR